MSDNGCTVTIDGTYSGTYYTNCDFVEYLRGNLVNTSNSTIYLYPNLLNSRDSNTNYISISPYKYPVYYRSGYQSVEITNITTVKYNTLSQYYREYKFVSLMVFVIILVFMVFNIFKS